MSRSPDDAPDDRESKEDASAEEKPSEATSSPGVGTGEAPGPGGYDGLDPKTDMPRMPMGPDAHDDDDE